MHTVLGLSLDSDHFAWVLVDATDGTVLDHDALTLHADPELAGEVARSAHAIAENCGFQVDRIRVTWTVAAAHDGLRLRTRLGHLGFGDIESVPIADAKAVPIDTLIDTVPTGITPRLVLAYGAAMAVAHPGETVTKHPAVGPIPQQRTSSRRRAISALLGSAAAAVLGLLCLSAGAGPETHPGIDTTSGPTSGDVGWVAVPVPPPAATAATTRKVVGTPSNAEPPSSPTAQHAFAHLDAAPTTAVQATAEPVRQPHLSGTAHLFSTAHAPGTMPGPVQVVDAAPEPDLTEIAQAFAALP